MVLIQKTKLGCHFWGGAGSAPGLGINNQVTLPATWRCRDKQWENSDRGDSRKNRQDNPFGLGSPFNAYAYVSNNPVKRVDPWGLFQFEGIDDEQQQQFILDAVTYLQAAGMNDPNVFSFFEQFGYDVNTALAPGLGPVVKVDPLLEGHGQSDRWDTIYLGKSCFTDSK